MRSFILAHRPIATAPEQEYSGRVFGMLAFVGQAHRLVWTICLEHPRGSRVAAEHLEGEAVVAGLVDGVGHGLV